MIERVAGEELPPPSAMGVLVRVWVTSFIATAHLPRKKRAKAFLKYAGRMLESMESISNVSPIRPASAHEDVQKARRQALALYRAQEPHLRAMLRKGRT